MFICSICTTEQWAELRPQLLAANEEAWKKAVEVFECRMQERFFRCIELLLNEGKTDLPENERTFLRSMVPGFAIMALCCILIETLQAFYEGHIMTPPNVPDHQCTYPDGICLKAPQLIESVERCTFPDNSCVKTPPTARSFVQFLRASPHFGDFNARARSSFSIQIRNGLLHDAETRGGWLIRKTDPSGKIVERRGQHYILNRTRFYDALKAEFLDYLARLNDSSEKVLRDNFLKKMDNICQFEPTVQ
jgi:hypothetical protein